VKMEGVKAVSSEYPLSSNFLSFFHCAIVALSFLLPFPSFSFIVPMLSRPPILLRRLFGSRLSFLTS